MSYRLKQVIGGKGVGPERLARALRGIAAAGARLLAAGDQEVKVFDRQGRLLGGYPTEKAGFSVAVAPDGRVYVGQAGQVEIFTAEGRRADLLGDPERLGRITALGFHGDDLFLGDATRRCIHRYRSDGTFRNAIGADSRTRGLMIPNGWVDFAVAPDGTIHAANPGKHRVERYSPEGKLLGRFGRFGGITYPDGFSGCCNPTNVALLGDGRIVVTTKAPPQVKIYTAGGELVEIFGTAAFDPGSRNMDVAAGAGGWIYVADTARLRICAFAPAAEGAPPEVVPAGQGGEARDE